MTDIDGDQVPDDNQFLMFQEEMDMIDEFQDDMEYLAKQVDEKITYQDMLKQQWDDAIAGVDKCATPQDDDIIVNDDLDEYTPDNCEYGGCELGGDPLGWEYSNLKKEED